MRGPSVKTQSSGKPNCDVADIKVLHAEQVPGLAKAYIHTEAALAQFTRIAARLGQSK